MSGMEQYNAQDVQRLGRLYTVVKQIGVGGYGIV